jgi:hypothetical protein
VQVKRGGQGRGRTADLPIFRTTVMRSYSFATVLDLRRKIHPVAGERRRTNANETEMETTREPQPATYTPADRCRRNLPSALRVTPAAPECRAPITLGMSPNRKHPVTRRVHLAAVMHAADVFRHGDQQEYYVR